MSSYKRVDYTTIYGGIMQFNKNKDVGIHRWYPFVEGYSKEFIKSILEELDFIPKVCLDPFSGSGTTSLELQNSGIKCFSFEISPFMYDLSRTKLKTNYSVNGFEKTLFEIKSILSNNIDNIENITYFPKYKNYVENDSLEKWHYDKDVMLGICDIKYAIKNIKNKNYESLYKIALASILLQVSNMYRNGKCLSYKRKTNNRVKYNRESVKNLFLSRLEDIFRSDIEKLSKFYKENKIKSNYPYCYKGDARKLVKKLDDDSIDLVITSPPYLNSRDYTDSYIDELRVLEYLKEGSSEQEYRAKTLCSHVQVKWDYIKPLDIPLLVETYNKISAYKDKFWNKSLLNMIAGYFNDMDVLFGAFSKKLKEKGRIYFNVGNSAYFGVEVKVDEIIAAIAEQKGFKVVEIRDARRMPPSSQQRSSFGHLMESVIVLEK